MSRLHRQTNQRLGKDRVLKVERKIVINKEGFTRYLSHKYSTSYDDASVWVDAMLAALAECINRNRKVAFSGFGSFTRKKLPRRKIHDLNCKGEMIEIPERWALRFIPGAAVKASITTDEAKQAGINLYDRRRDRAEKD